MRNFVLLLVLVMPALGACSAASAQAPAEIGKPVCAHYDDTAKTARQANTATATTPATATTASTTNVMVAVVANSPVAPTPSASSATTTQSRGGGNAGLERPRSAPHWQTFLPGMFK